MQITQLPNPLALKKGVGEGRDFKTDAFFRGLRNLLRLLFIAGTAVKQC